MTNLSIILKARAPFSDKVASEMMSLMTDEELATMLSRLEQQELDCQTGSGAVPGKHVRICQIIL